MKVVVLMSTWHGEQFVIEQLHSILSQLAPSARVLIRDDGSTDGTVERIQSLSDKRISIIKGAHCGFARSFLALLDAAPDDADVIMLSDQDDVWLPGKVARACSHLALFADQPALYCSRLQLADINLNPIGLSPTWPRPPSFQNALTENIVTGCTCAMNQPALRLARNCGDRGLIYFHDWWLYLVISAFGTVVVDSMATILYRQHGGNVIGMGAGWRRYLSILQFIGKKSWIHIMFDQIENFRSVFGDQLDDGKQMLLEQYFIPQQPRSIIRLLFSTKRFRQTMLYDILLRALLLGTWLAGRGLSSK